MPYLRHYEYGRTKEGMGDVKSQCCCHNQVVTIPRRRTGDKASERIATTQNRARQGEKIHSTKDDPHDQQGQPRRCHYLKDATTSNYSSDVIIPL
jgi:hypothetical protein